jgi:hypothetical protein
MDEEMRKKIDAKAQDILANPEKYSRRWKQRMLERIAYYEVLEEEKATKTADEAPT